LIDKNSQVSIGQLTGAVAGCQTLGKAMRGRAKSINDRTI
jgi:hypothetical protein